MTLAAMTAGISCAGMAQTDSAHKAQPAAAPAADTGTSPADTKPEAQLTIEHQIEFLKNKLDQLEAEVKQQRAITETTNDAAALSAAEKQLVSGNRAMAVNSAAPVAGLSKRAHAVTPRSAETATTASNPHAPAFSDWDWTWLNGNPRNKDTAWDSKFFTPEIRADMTYNYDFNRPIDNTMSGSSEMFRANEIQLEQLGVGGDFHLDNAHVRFMTQYGLYSTATVRNDPSYAKGQWDLANADRYLSEAYGGYHIPNVMHGINFDAGIFMSYIGLFSYYNFDNWAYQPSFVSSNTPWFFQGVRIQIFPTEHLKIEPWFINGWQSYASANSRKGLGGQIKWTPYPWMNIISNNYGLGHDDLYVPGRSRLHTDDSIEIKYYDKPARDLDKMAMSFTGDMGCEHGAGVNCHNDRNGNFKQSFVGYMLYNRLWFDRDHYGFTIGGGEINNPGRYLVLIPPINGETAASDALNSPYFTGNPGDQFKARDGTLTFDYMPVQWLTWRWEYGYRHSNVPYWNGRGGMTPPAFLGAPYGTNNGQPTEFACMDGSAVPAAPGQAGQVTVSGLTMTAPSYVSAYCATNSISGTPHGGVWFPDLRRDEQYVDIDLMVKF